MNIITNGQAVCLDEKKPAGLLKDLVLPILEAALLNLEVTLPPSKIRDYTVLLCSSLEDLGYLWGTA